MKKISKQDILDHMLARYKELGVPIAFARDEQIRFYETMGFPHMHIDPDDLKRLRYNLIKAIHGLELLEGGVLMAVVEAAETCTEHDAKATLEAIDDFLCQRVGIPLEREIQASLLDAQTITNRL